MKKKGQKCLTLGVWRKPLNLWPRKMTKKKKGEKGSREESERKTKSSFKRTGLIPICLKKWNPIDREESKCTWK